MCSVYNMNKSHIWTWPVHWCNCGQKGNISKHLAKLKLEHGIWKGEKINGENNNIDGWSFYNFVKCINFYFYYSVNYRSIDLSEHLSLVTFSNGCCVCLFFHFGTIISLRMATVILLVNQCHFDMNTKSKTQYNLHVQQ
jgi:hypothetical protein